MRCATSRASTNDGVAYLHGCLPSYYLKQLAQEIAAGVEGVRLVINKIEVTVHRREVPQQAW